MGVLSAAACRIFSSESIVSIDAYESVPVAVSHSAASPDFTALATTESSPPAIAIECAPSVSVELLSPAMIAAQCMSALTEDIRPSGVSAECSHPAAVPGLSSSVCAASVSPVIAVVVGTSGLNSEKSPAAAEFELAVQLADTRIETMKFRLDADIAAV